jgi:hypothetical protein
MGFHTGPDIRGTLCFDQLVYLVGPHETSDRGEASIVAKSTSSTGLVCIENRKTKLGHLESPSASGRTGSDVERGAEI